MQSRLVAECVSFLDAAHSMIKDAVLPHHQTQRLSGYLSNVLFLYVNSFAIIAAGSTCLSDGTCSKVDTWP